MNSKKSGNTEVADYAFRVKERYPGPGWLILLEPRHGNLSILQDGLLCFDLHPSLSKEQAQELASLMGERIEGVAHSDLRDAPRASPIPLNE